MCVDVLAEQPILLKILMLHPPLPRTHTRTITTTIGDNWTIHNIVVKIGEETVIRPSYRTGNVCAMIDVPDAASSSSWTSISTGSTKIGPKMSVICH